MKKLRFVRYSDFPGVAALRSTPILPGDARLWSPKLSVRPSCGRREIAVIVKTGNSSFWQNVQTGAFDCPERA